MRFYADDGTGGSDEKLATLAKLKLEFLHDVTLLNCPLVTDVGIQHLSEIKSLRLLQLEGTSITDEALETMASKMNLTGINVANCPKVTMRGLSRIASLETLDTFTFSAETLSQADVVSLINEFKENVKWPAVVDVEGKLDAAALKAIAKEKGITLSVRRTGALQDIARGGGWQ